MGKSRWPLLSIPLALAAWMLAGCGSGTSARNPGNGNDPLVEAQAAGTVTPQAGGTISLPGFRIEFPPGAVSAPTQVQLQSISLTPYKDVIPGTPGPLVRVCRVRQEQLALKGDKTAKLTLIRPRPYGSVAKLSVYRQERLLNPIGQATANGSEYSVEIDRLGLFLWVLESNFCLQFDGRGDVVSIPHSGTIKFGTDDAFTVECWFRSSEQRIGTGTYRPIVGTWSGNTAQTPYPYPYELRLWLGDQSWADGEVEFVVWDGEKVQSSTDPGSTERPGLYVPGTYNDGQWHHMAGVRKGRVGMWVYMDGELTASSPGDPGLKSIYNDRPVTIGGYHPSWVRGFRGEIDEVRIWGVARTHKQVQGNYTRRLTGSESGLRALWSFDEGGGTVAHDMSANSNHGSLLGDARWIEADWPLEP